MNVSDDLGLGDAQQVVIPFQIRAPIGKSGTSVISLLELMPLDHGTHGTIYDQDPFTQ